MTVIIAKGDEFRGVPLVKVRNILKAWRYRGKGPIDISERKDVDMDPRVVLAVLQEARDMGFIGKEDDGWRNARDGLTPAGKAIAFSKARPRMAKDDARRVLEGLLSNAARLNAERGFPVKVDRVWLFGSIIDETRLDVGDIDVVIETSRKLTPAEKEGFRYWDYLARLVKAYGEEGIPDSVYAEEIEASSGVWLKHQEAPKETWLSMDSLVPMPDAYASESFGLVGYAWILSEQGPKWIDSVKEPEILDAGAAAGQIGEAFAQEAGDVVAVYPKFSTGNSPVFHALRNASAGHPELTLIGVYMDPDCSQFRYYAARNGEVLVRGELDDGDLPDSCFLEYEDGDKYPGENATLNHLAEVALLEIENRPSPRP